MFDPSGFIIWLAIFLLMVAIPIGFGAWLIRHYIRTEIKKALSKEN